MRSKKAKKVSLVGNCTVCGVPIFSNESGWQVAFTAISKPWHVACGEPVKDEDYCTDDIYCDGEHPGECSNHPAEDEEEQPLMNQCALCGGWFEEADLNANFGYCGASCREIGTRKDEGVRG